MNHLDFLSLADDLKLSQSEAGLRSSVSRGYYAVYHHIKTYLVQQRLVAEKAAFPHHMVHTFLFESGKCLNVEELKKLGKKVETLKIQRNDADYTMESTDFDAKTCDTIVRSCHRIIRDFDCHKGQNLINGISTFLTKVGQSIPYR